MAEAQASSDTPPRPMQALPRDVPPVAPPAPAAVAGAGAAGPAGWPGRAGRSGWRAAQGPLPPGVVRASDTDRAETVGALRDEFAAGRLSHDTFLYRMHAAMEARHVTDLPPLLADLPPARAARAGRARPDQGHLESPDRPPGRFRATPLGTTGSARGCAPHGNRRGERRTGPPADERHPAASRGPRQHQGIAPPVPLPFPRTDEGFFTIGRDARCDLAIDHMTVSRIHARLERTPEGWVLKDLSSTNGTRVNGWRVRGQVTVRAGDVIRFGDVEYTLTPDQGLPGVRAAERGWGGALEMCGRAGEQSH